jgi:rare lipoprotein A
MFRSPRINRSSVCLLLLAGASLAACATAPPPRTSVGSTTAPASQYKVGKPYRVNGVWYSPKEEPDYDRIGLASWYGNAFHMKPTANGEFFDMYAVTAAHPTLPLPSIVEVTNLENGKSLQVRVNDRGPFVAGRLIDLSAEGARQLGFDRQGVARVRVRYVGPAPLRGPYSGRRYAAVSAPAPANPPATSTGPQPAAQLPAPPAVAPAAFRVQAGAFSDQTNARRAVDRLSATGVAVIEPVQRNGLTLYRVLLEGGGDESAAERMRAAVAAFGFTDARVVRDF